MIILETSSHFLFGLNRHQTTSSGFGMSMFSFEMLNLFPLAVIATPPPRLVLGLGVDIYLVSFSSSSSSILFLCLRFSFCSQTSARIEKSQFLSAMSSARQHILDQTDLMLNTENVGKDNAVINLLFLTMVILLQALFKHSFFFRSMASMDGDRMDRVLVAVMRVTNLAEPRMF